MMLDPSTLLLRQLTVEDVTDDYVSWLNQPEVNEFLEARHQVPFTQSSVKDFVANCLQIQRHHWGIFVKNRHVGNISCSAYHKLYRWVDISNLIGAAEFRGTHLAKFALVGAMNHLFKSSGFHRISAGTYSSHLSGITLLTNVGFKKEGVLRDWGIHHGRYIDYLKFSILEHEWPEHSKRFPQIRVLPPPWEAQNGNL